MDIKKKRETFIKWFLLITLLGSLGILFAYFKQDVPLPVESLCFAGILAAKFVSLLIRNTALNFTEPLPLIMKNHIHIQRMFA